MHRWIIKNKEDFAEWIKNGFHPHGAKDQLDAVGTPEIFPTIIIWHWYESETVAGHKMILAHTFVMPRDFEYM